MANNSNTRDVKMVLSVETLGEAGITKLGTTVRELAKQGGDAAPEFARLADEIDRLGDQAKALSSFQQLADETAQVAQRQEQAATAAGELRARLEELATATTSARDRQAAVKAELLEAQDAYRGTTAEIKRMTIESTRAEQQDTAFIAEKRKLKLEQLAQAESVIQLSRAFKESNAAVKEAEQAETALGRSYQQAAGRSEAATTALEGHNQALRESAAAATALGTSTDNVAASQAEITAALNRVGNEADVLRLRLERLKVEQEELANSSAFEKMFQDAQRLVETIRLTEQFDNALQRTAQAQRAAAAAADEINWQKEAFEIVEAAEAAQRLARETEVLAAVERELASIRAFDKQAEDAKKLNQAGDYVRFWREELDKGGTAAQRAATAAQDAAQRIDSAFRTVGTRSAQELTAEITRVRAAMDTIRASAGATGGAFSGAFSAGTAKIKELERDLRELNGTLTTGDRLAGLFKNSLGQIAAGNLVADGVGYLVNKVKELAVAFVGAIVQLDQMRRGLTAVYQSSTIAASQILFLKNTANAAGVAFGSISQAFVKFSAATKSANIPLKDTNDLFAAVTRSAATLGLSGEQVTGMLEALGQMASKGTVSMEELRQQLGDRLPGALSLVAKGLGITDAQLIKLVEGGGLAARDLFPALTKALGEMQGATDGLVPSYERLKNVLTETAQNAGDSGWTQLLTFGLKALTLGLGLVVLPLSALSELLFGMAKAAGVLVGALTTLTNPAEELGRIFTEASARQQQLTDSFDTALGATKKVTAATTEHNKAMTATGQAAAALTAATTTTSIAQQAQARIAKIAADANLGLSSQLVQNIAYLEELFKVQEKDTESKEKLAKAIKLEGEALTSITALRGSEQAALETATITTEKNLAALTAVSDAHRTETELLTLKRDEIVRVAQAQDGNTLARQQEIEAINKKIVVSQAETEQAAQAVAVAKADLVTRKLQQQAYLDNSAALGVLSAALTVARINLEQVQTAKSLGLATDAQVLAATELLAKTQYLYNDAVKDSIANIDRESRSKQANISVSQAKLNVEQANLLSMAAMFRAQGDSVMATEFEIQAKYKQIEVARLTMQAKKLEAQATIDAANAELKSLQATNELTAAKKAEIEIRLANAKAKLIEAGAGEAAIRTLQAEIDAMRLNQATRGNGTQSITADTTARDRNTQSIDKQTSALERQKGALTHDGFQTNADGSAAGTFNSTVPTDKAFQVRQDVERGKKFGPEDKAMLEEALAQAVKAKEFIDDISRRAPGAVSTGAQQDADAMLQAAQSALRGLQGATQAATGQAAAPTGPRSQFDGQTNGAKARTININVGGRKTSLTVASEDDANALTGVFRQLESAAGAAS